MCPTWWFNVPLCMGYVEPLIELLSDNDFDIIYLCYSIIIDDIFIQGMDITGSQFLDLAQIFLEENLKRCSMCPTLPYSR